MWRRSKNAPISSSRPKEHGSQSALPSGGISTVDTMYDIYPLYYSLYLYHGALECRRTQPPGHFTAPLAAATYCTVI